MASGDVAENEEFSEEDGSFQLDKIASLQSVLARDLKVADLKLSLYISACEAIPEGLLLRPSPPGFYRDRDVDEEKLLEANREIPTPKLLKYYMERPYGRKIKNQTLDILYWILAARREPRIVSVPPREFKSVLNKVKLTSDWEHMPDFVFKLMYSATSQWEMKWQAVKKHRPTKFGYYTADVPSFHSLIHYGIHAAIRADSPRICLVEDLRFALDMAPEGWTWGKSSIGSLISVIALVEYIENAVEFGTVELDKIPDHRLALVSDGDQARLRYILVYVKKKVKDLQVPDYSWLPLFCGRGCLNLMLTAFLILGVTAVKSGRMDTWSQYLSRCLSSLVKLSK